VRFELVSRCPYHRASNRIFDPIGVAGYNGGAAQAIDSAWLRQVKKVLALKSGVPRHPGTHRSGKRKPDAMAVASESR
jgi:hypothetical protein